MPRTYKRKTNWGSTPCERAAVNVSVIEKELADHIKKLADQFHGLTLKKCCELAMELANRYNIPVPKNWREKAALKTDVAIPFDDTSDQSFNEEISEPDIIIVKSASKCRSYNYTGLVESLEGNDISARFLRRIRGNSGSEKPTFAFKEKDEASFPLSDVLKKLEMEMICGLFSEVHICENVCKLSYAQDTHV
uniref:Uncharacterized protein n=1 Tax=Paramormyrops kingsleyae TaxID=1676925 RepID=A0A3B3RFG3_9TELE